MPAEPQSMHLRSNSPEADQDSNFEILGREDFSDVTYLLEVRHPLMAKAAKPGQ